MENKYQKSLKARIAGGVAAVGLAACCVATPAFAAGSGVDPDPADGTTTETSANTAVTVKTDTNQVKWSAPTVIAFAAGTDGTLVGPSVDKVQIMNKSAYPIHVTNISATEVSPFKLVSDVAALGGPNNAIQLSLKTGNTVVDAKAGADTRANADFEMGYEGSGSDVISIEASGKIARTSVDLTKACDAATITWTVAAGAAQDL